MGENRLMCDLYEENQRLKERIKELESKHFSECGQIAHYSDELAEAKELLKLAMDDMTKEADCGICLHNNDGKCPIEVTACKFKWRFADEALKLIGEESENNGADNI